MAEPRNRWVDRASAAALALAAPGADPGSARAPTDAAEPRSTAAFEEIVHRYERRVLALCLRLLGRREDAEDAAQESFLRLFRALDRIDPERPVLPYLYRLTVNVCRDLGRRRRLHLVPLDDAGGAAEPRSSDGDPARDLRLAEERRIAAAALGRLPEKQRTALVLRDLHGLTTREVAEVLGVAEVTVRTQISRARLKVKELRAGWLRSEEGRP